MRPQSLWMLGALAAGCANRGPNPVDAAHYALSPCPKSPNCVSSLADPEDAEHHVPALALHGDPATAMQRISTVVSAHPRTEVLHLDAKSLHATYTSKWFRFVDDVHIRLDTEHSVLQIRSASRVGYDDMEANPDRVALIRADWNQSAISPDATAPPRVPSDHAP